MIRARVKQLIFPVAFLVTVALFVFDPFRSHGNLRIPDYGPLATDSNEENYFRGGVTPVSFNSHNTIQVTSGSIQHISLNAETDASGKRTDGDEVVLILCPLRNSAPYLPKFFEILTEMTYPHHLIDVGIMVSDSTDETLAIAASEFERIQTSKAPGMPFRNVKIVTKDFGMTTSQDVEDRHAFEYQAIRRKAMGKARNFLLSATLMSDHSWVLWRDSDIVESPSTIIEDLKQHQKDVIVPNIWFHRLNEEGVDIEGRFDYNSWIESEEGLKLANSLSKDTVLAEGYPEYTTNRNYMARMGDRHQNPHEEVQLDAIGGVTILVKADIHRAGINFPSYPFENQAETEGFGKMAKRAGYEVVGLPNYVVWHIDTEEKSRY